MIILLYQRFNMSATMGSATHDEKTLGKGKVGDENGMRATVNKF